MKKIVFFCMAMVLSAPSLASDAVSSELGHTLTGVVMGGAATWAADRYWPENRALIGFSAASIAGILGEVYDSTQPNGRFSWLDMFVTAVGGAIGAYGTDRFILAPVVSQRQGSRSSYGLAAGYRF